MRKEIVKADCPAFDDGDNLEAILEWAEVSVEWSDIFVNGREERTCRPELAHWSMVWKPGFIGFTSLKENNDRDRARARWAAACFIYLWCKGIEASLACHLAEAYVNHYEVSFDDEEAEDGTDSST